MKVSRTESKELQLEFENDEEFEKFFETTEQQGYFDLQLDQIPEGCIFRAKSATSPRSRKIKPVAVSGKRVWLVEPKPEEVAPVKVGESLFDQIRKLPLTERVTLALKADFAERRILMQENNSKIHEFLLRNPRMSESEIAWLARNPASPMQTILSILNHASWMGVEPIRVGILTNPKTPPQTVIQMIPALNGSDLMKMHQARYLREDIRMTVEREMKKRGMRVVRRDSES